MHILIGVLTAVAGLIWALHSLQNAGVDLNAFNPFTWVRRRKWEKQLGTKPMHELTDSLEAAALLVVAIARENGDITREAKLEVLTVFEESFGVKRNRAIELFSASSHMLQGVMNMDLEVRHVLAPSKDQFQQSQVEILLQMLKKVATLDHEASDGQNKIISAVKAELLPEKIQASHWS